MASNNYFISRARCWAEIGVVFVHPDGPSGTQMDHLLSSNMSSTKYVNPGALNPLDAQDVGHLGLLDPLSIPLFHNGRLNLNKDR